MSENTHELIQMQVTRLLREERLKRKKSLNVLAKECGISRQMLSYVEQQERNPSLDVLLRITEALGVKLETIIQQARKLAS